MAGYKLLFTAPVDFDLRVQREYNKFLPTFFAAGLRERRHLVANGAEVWVCNPNQQFVIDEDVLFAMPKLRILGTPSTGTNHIDKAACEARGVKIFSLLDDREGLGKISASSEFAMLMVLTMLRRHRAHEIQGKTVGIVGLGRIGGNLMNWFEAMGCRVIFRDPGKPLSVPMRRLFSISDIVVVSCELNEHTTRMIGQKELERMPHEGIFVNVSRGEVLREEELLPTFKRRPDLRIALDVLCGETTGTANPKPLLDARMFVTPHIAGDTFESRTKAARMLLGLLKREYGQGLSGRQGH